MNSSDEEKQLQLITSLKEQGRWAGWRRCGAAASGGTALGAAAGANRGRGRGPVRPPQSPLRPKRHRVLRPGRRSCSVFPQWDRAPRRTRARDPGEGTRVGGGQSQGTHPSPRGSSEPHSIAGRGVVAQLAWLLAQAPPLHTLAFLGLHRSLLLGSV